MAGCDVGRGGQTPGFGARLGWGDEATLWRACLYQETAGGARGCALSGPTLPPAGPMHRDSVVLPGNKQNTEAGFRGSEPLLLCHSQLTLLILIARMFESAMPVKSSTGRLMGGCAKA